MPYDAGNQHPQNFSTEAYWHTPARKPLQINPPQQEAETNANIYESAMDVIDGDFGPGYRPNFFDIPRTHPADFFGEHFNQAFPGFTWEGKGVFGPGFPFKPPISKPIEPPVFTTLAVGEEEGGGIPPQPPVTPPGPNPPDVTTLAVGEEEGGGIPPQPPVKPPIDDGGGQAVTAAIGATGNDEFLETIPFGSPLEIAIDQSGDFVVLDPANNSVEPLAESDVERLTQEFIDSVPSLQELLQETPKPAYGELQPLELAIGENAALDPSGNIRGELAPSDFVPKLVFDQRPVDGPVRWEIGPGIYAEAPAGMSLEFTEQQLESGTFWNIGFTAGNDPEGEILPGSAPPKFLQFEGEVEFTQGSGWQEIKAPGDDAIDDARPDAGEFSDPWEGFNEAQLGFPNEQIKEAVKDWIQENNLNRYGDPMDTIYAGGTPLFIEGTNQTFTVWEYIQSKPNTPDFSQLANNTAPQGIAIGEPVPGTNPEDAINQPGGFKPLTLNLNLASLPEGFVLAEQVTLGGPNFIRTVNPETGEIGELSAQDLATVQEVLNEQRGVGQPVVIPPPPSFPGTRPADGVVPPANVPDLGPIDPEGTGLTDDTAGSRLGNGAILTPEEIQIANAMGIEF